MFGFTESLFVLLPILISLGAAIFIIILLVRLVRAVEKIANKIESQLYEYFLLLISFTLYGYHFSNFKIWIIT